MQISRREFAQLLATAGVAAMLPVGAGKASDNLYDIGTFGDVRLLHIADIHAQLKPVYYREPNVNIGIHNSFNRPPHLVGQAFFDYYGIRQSSREAYAFTYVEFSELAERFGKVGGYAYIKTLIDRLRMDFGSERTLLLDSGDSWQGSGTALWTRGREMVEANNLLGIDIATGHWEFTYTPYEFRRNLEAFNGEFVAQNVFVTEYALFDGSPAYDESTGHAFMPYTMRTIGGFDIAIIGQAFPYTPIANPGRFVPDWTFGLRVEELEALLFEIRILHKPDAVVLLSHNGMDVDLKLASMVSGIDVILGGHTHDAIPTPVPVRNAEGVTWVTNAGSNGKFVAVLDLAFGSRGIRDMRYKLLPVFSNELTPDAEMDSFIKQSHNMFAGRLEEPLAETESLLYRRGNFNGTFDEVICSSLRAVGDTEIALTPGFRWGTTVLPGQMITMEDVLGATALTYPETFVREFTGEQLKHVLEDVADNLFHADPFYQQGGDMIRSSGIRYAIRPSAKMGSRISDLRLETGELIDANAIYKVAGWASVGEQSSGPPVWDWVAEYLRDQGSVRVDKPYNPRLLLDRDNPGVADYFPS